MTQYCFLNGEIVPLEDAKVSVLDIGLLRGYGIYDGLTVIGGRVIHFADHWQRFVRGAKALNLKVPITEESLEKVIIEIAEKSGLATRANIRLILTGGKTIEGIEYDFEKPTFYVVAEKWTPLPSEYFEKGAKLITYEHQRYMPEIKTITYTTAVNLQGTRKSQKAVEILYTHDGQVLECATSNIFLVKEKTLITPGKAVLEGVTQKIVLETAARDYKIERREVSVGELKSADEIFITSSFKDVAPITKIDDFVIGTGEVGPVTKDIMSRFTKYIS